MSSRQETTPQLSTLGEISIAIEAIFQQLSAMDSRIMSVERERSTSRDTEIVNLYLRMNAIISASLEEKMGHLDLIARLRAEADQFAYEKVQLSQLLEASESRLRQPTNNKNNKTTVYHNSSKKDKDHKEKDQAVDKAGI